MKTALALSLAVPTIQVSAPVAPPALPAAPLAAPSLAAPALAPALAVPAAPVPVQAPLALLSGVSGGIQAAAAKGEERRPLDAAFDQRAIVPPEAAELVHAPAPSLFDKTAFARGVAEGRLSYGAELASPNPVSAKTLAGGGGVSAVFVDGTKAERGQLSRLVDALSAGPAVVVARFAAEDDPELKPKLDEGVLGATLDGASSLKQTLRFLDKLYLPPLGKRSVGPSDVTRYLGAVDDFVGRSNGVMLGGVTITTAEGVRNIASIVKAKGRGLRFVEVGPGLTAEQKARVEAAARSAGVALFGRASSRGEALALHARGYRHVIVVSDLDAAERASAAYADVPLDRSREPALGAYAFLMSPDAAMARRLSEGAGGLWIDGEDGHFTLPRIREMIAAAGSAPAVVRAAAWNAPDVAAYVRAGAAGVVAPQVSSAGQARAFVAAVKGANPAAKAVVMIENREALARLEEIVRVPGVDALFIGPYDLSLSLGLKASSAEFKAAVARIEAAARAAGVPLGGLSKSRAETYALKARGYEFVATVSDQGALASALQGALGAGFAAAGYKP